MCRLQLSKLLGKETARHGLIFLSKSDSLFLLADSVEIPNFSIVHPYGLDFQTRNSDLKKLEDYFEHIIPLLSSILNDIHKSNLSDRQWEILFGHWLRRFIAVSINAAGKLNLALESFEINEVISEHIPFGALVPRDTRDFTRMLNDPKWNIAFKTKFLLSMLKDQNTRGTGFIYVGDFPEQLFHSKTLGESNSKGFKGIRKGLQNFLSSYSRSVLSSTYLPRFYEWGLSFSLMSIPQGLKFQKCIESGSLNSVSRAEMSEAVNKVQTDDLLLRTILRLLPETFPIAYLENFKPYSKEAMQLKLPRSPKYIFTSNDFDSCEFFKYWVVSKINCGSKYIVGQHGNVYGTSLYFRNTTEERTSDKFVTWGWTSTGKGYVRGLNLKNPRGRILPSSPTGGFLFTHLNFPIPMTTWDSDEEFFFYLENVSTIFRELNPDVYRQLTLRLYPTKTRLGWDDGLYWKEKLPDLKIDYGSTKITDVYSNYRLVVHGYESTGILETLSSNYPTLGYLPNGLNELRPEAQAGFSKLINVGILHSNPKLLALKLNQIASSTEEWWLSEEVQSARLEFMETYARTSKNPIRYLLREVFSEKFPA